MNITKYLLGFYYVSSSAHGRTRNKTEFPSPANLQFQGEDKNVNT